MTKQDVEKIVKHLKEKLNIQKKIDIDTDYHFGARFYRLKYDDFYSYVFSDSKQTTKAIVYFFEKVMGLICEEIINNYEKDVNYGKEKQI